jgi:hypothetical protein
MGHDAPSIGSDLHRLPTMVREIQIDAVVMLGDADVDCTLRSIELGARFEQIEN